MKRSFGKYLLVSILLLQSFCGWGQLRIYTRAYMMQDFRSKPTKVVLSGSQEFNSVLRREVTSLWTVSPFEFCSEGEYKKQKDNPDCYFLHPEIEKGIVFLTLSRGGKKNDDDALKRPITLVSLPISGESDNSGRELIYMPAFISIIQDYADIAVSSEFAAYRGLNAIKIRTPKEFAVYTVREEADEAFLSQFTDAVSVLTITPDGRPKSKPRYEVGIGSSDYRLYRYAKH